MVLQRQVPARPVAKAGEGFAGDDAAGDGRSDAFSAALSQEKRSAVAEPQDKRTVAAQSGKVASDEETDADTETGEPDDQLESGSGQSDEVLNLLSGLMSSAAFCFMAYSLATAPAALVKARVNAHRTPNVNSSLSIFGI